jgi:hypothetical protein
VYRLILSQGLSPAGSASSMAVSTAFNASGQLSVMAAIPSFMSISTRSWISVMEAVPPAGKR